jgi:AraC-like DNA-binding protein
MLCHFSAACQGAQVTVNGTPVERAELVTQDVDLLASLVRQQYVGHAATFRCPDPATVNGQMRTATAAGLTAGWLGLGGIEYTARMDPFPAPTTALVRRGAGLITTGRHEQRFTAGDAVMVPLDQPSSATMADAGYVTLQVPWAALHALAEEGAGVPAGLLRFYSTAPVSAARRRGYVSTATFIYDQLLTSGATEADQRVVQALTGLAAAAMLETFPNTTMTTPHLPGPGWVTPASVRRAAAFIDEHAGQPVTVTDIATAAGLTPRALRHAFRSRYAITLTQYQRQVRLERAHLELLTADPHDGVTVASTARKWGWASPSRFAAAYRQRFGTLPSHTLSS